MPVLTYRRIIIDLSDKPDYPIRREASSPSFVLQPRNAVGYDCLPGALRALLRVMGLFPGMRRLNRLLRYRF
jgi:hypothetical protein